MEKTIYFYKYIDGVNDLSFPEQGQIQTSEFRVDYKRMGAAPTITCTILHHLCLDKIWDENVYVVFNNERFFLKQIPTSSYSNSDSRYKHDVELVGERAVLDNVYFYDVAKDDIEVDKPISNSSNFVFFGDIHEFASRLNYSLSYSNVDYKVVVDSDITSESKSVSFQDQFISNALQECYNVYGLPYYFIGKTIHIGFTNNAVTHTFKYGVDESLLSIQKQNANYKIVNRVTGVGSSDNIPYYYPNDYESKEEVEANGGKWVKPQQNLMPPIYRETLGDERFYNALNNTYISPQTGEFYSFENPFVEGKPKEHIVNFEDIKPSIKGITNSENQRIDMFIDFAYDADDNDETDDEGNYLHPYFFAKLRKFNGDYGFNLFDHAIEEQEMVISMTGGSCGSCEFIIGVDDETQKNTVQVNSSGNLVRDENGNIKFGTPQDRQNDTRNYEVWVALKKDINTFGVIMPNAYNNYKPSVNDTFVILHIDLPKAYILAAENNLKEQLIKYMAMNNSEKFTFSIEFSRIFFADNPQILEQLNENARIQIEYDNEYYDLYVSSYSYSMSDGIPLPEIKVELSDTLTVQQNALQNAISEVKQDIMSSVGSVDFLKQGLAYFLRKDTSDRTRGKLSSDVGFEVGKYVSGASGAIIYKDSSTGHTIGEVDKLYVRMKAYFETIGISNVDTVSGKQIISPAGSIKCIGVDELDNSYRCYFIGEQDGAETSNLFHVNDQAYSQTFNAKEGVNNKISNTYYWRLITGVSNSLVVYKNQKCHYIDLSKTDCDNGSDIPKNGDIINHRGSRTDVDRMNFIESSSVDAFSPNITLFHGVNSYSLDGKDYVSYGVDKTSNKAYMNVYGDMFVGNRDGSTYMRYTPEEGLVIKGKLDIETKLGNSTLKDLISASSPEGYQEFVEKVTKDIEGLQAQIDGAIESYFYQYAPTLSNYPASSWTTNEIKKAHLNDTFTNLVDGRSWRWTVENGTYKWTEITDTATTQALALAGQAKDSADGKRRVFIETPYPPYDLGDLWSRGSEFPLMICIVQKTDGLYEESDWGYADNNTELKDGIDSLNYLKDALKEDTSIEGGLIQSSLIKLGYTSLNAFNVMSGSNGLYNSALHGGGIASWWGGDTYDLLDYYNWDGTQWIEKSGVTVPNNIPSGLIRFDGTGYFAKGKFWWDNNGEIHADPTALFLSFDVEVGDETLAQTIVSLRTNLEKLAELWVKVDVEGGVSYIKTNNDVVSNGDIIAYSTGSALPSLPIASSSNYGLVKIDGATLRYDDNGRLYVAVGGGSGGGISSVIPSGSGNAVTGLIYDGSSKSLTYQLGNSFLPLSGGTMNNTNLVGNLNADLLDGYHESAFLRYRGGTDIDQELTLWNSLGIKQYINALPDGIGDVYNYGEVISLPGDNVRFDIYVSDVSTADHKKNGIYVRSGWSSNKQPWRRLAFTDDPVAAANKLSTTRYLWGQPFDGSGDVKGVIKGVQYVSFETYDYEGGSAGYVGRGGTNSNDLSITTYGENYIEFSTKSTERMRITKDGLIGIGTSTPSSELHVIGKSIFHSNKHFGNAGAMHIQNDYATNGWDRAINIYYPNMGKGSNVHIHIGVMDSEKNGGYIAYHYAGYKSDNNCMKIGLYAVDDILNVTANRCVGINTTTPQEALDVNGNIRVTGYARLTGDVFINSGTSSDNNNAAGKLFFCGSNNTDHGVYLSATKCDTYGRKRFGIFTTNAASETPNWIEAFSITPGGYVGIGTSLPVSELDVRGTFNLTGALNLNDDNQINGKVNGIAINYNCGKLVNTRIFNGTSSSIASFIGENRRMGLKTTTPEATLDVNGDSIFRNHIYVKKYHHIFMSTGEEGVYYTDDGLYLHDSNNAYVRHLIKFDSSGNASLGRTLNMDGSDQINGKWGGIALNHICSTYVDTSIWGGQANEIMRVFGEAGKVAIGPSAIESPLGRLNVDGDVYFENARFITTSGFVDGDYAYNHAIYGGYHGIDVCEFYENEFKFKTNGGDITSFKLNRYYADFNGTVRTYNCDFTGIHWNGNTRFKLSRDGEYSTWLQAGTDTTAENGRLYMSGLNGALLHQFNVLATTSNFKGSIIAEGDVTAYSDIRLKNRIESVNNVLDTIDTLDVFRYTWKDREDKTIHIGVSAQQVQTIYPEFVLTSDTEDGTDYLTVNYAALATCIAIQGIKELAKKGNERDKKIVSLEAEIEQLKERIKTLEAWS